MHSKSSKGRRMCAWSIVAASGKERRERREEEPGEARAREFGRRYRRKEPVVFQ